MSESITTISEKAFFNSTISQINLNYISTIEIEAFCNCSDLESIDLSSIQSLDTSCFANSSLIEINLPDNLTSIPSYAFYNCFKLTSFISNCNRFESYAFCNCTSLKMFKYNFKSLENIGANAFQNVPIEEFSVKIEYLFDSQLLELPIKKFIISSHLSSIDSMQSYSDNYGSNRYYFEKYYPLLESIEYTTDSNYILLVNMEQIEEIDTSDDPESRISVYIAGCPKLKKLPNRIENVFYIGDLPEIESVDLSYCKLIKRNSFYNCPKLKNVIGWGDHEMNVYQSLFVL